MAFDREKSIIAQNAGTTAANLVGSLVAAGAVNPDEIVDEFVSLRLAVFNGTLELAGSRVEHPTPTAQVPHPNPTDTAERTVSEGFPGTTEGTPFTVVAAGKLNDDHPSWLAKEYAYQQGRGKIADDDRELFDNRGRLPQFGGKGNPKAPWYRTTKGKVGLWPPKAAA